ncbi:MAG: enoyl-CoA hydratase-related protein [Solirubrobacterales bacterium]
MSIDDPIQLVSVFAERATAGDLDGMLALYESGATLVGPDGDEAAGGKAIRGQLARLLATKPRITPIEDPEVVSAGDIVLMRGRWRMALGEGAGAATVEATSTEVARRQSDGSWLYAIDHPVIDSLIAAGISPSPRPRSTGGEPRFEQLRYSEDGPLARITLERPEQRNALSMQLSEELLAALQVVQRSESVKVLVIQGAGETFCAGDDISEMPAWGNADQVMRRARLYQEMANSLEELDKVTIAAVDGFAVGGGLELTMACDFVVATRRSRWGMPEIDVGITPGWGGTTRLARLVGRRMAKEINLLGALYPASRAAELGLWNRIVDHNRLEKEVAALVAVLLSKNQQAARQLKFIINRGVEADLYTAQGFEALSAALSGAVNGAWRVPDADQGLGVLDFAQKGELWQRRRGLAMDFWTDRPTGVGDVQPPE